MYACNIFVLVHTTPPYSRDFAAFRQRLLLELAAIVCSHGAQLATPRQVEGHAPSLQHAPCFSWRASPLLTMSFQHPSRCRHPFSAQGQELQTNAVTTLRYAGE